MRTGPAQVRALETLARSHLDDREATAVLVGLFAQTRSLPVQRAIAEVFLRAGSRLDAADVALLRRHRMREGSGQDLVDVIIARVAAS
jgi:hypothetical protein